MSKDKKRDESKKERKLTVEAEVALLGLLLAIVSLIGLLNQGWLGGLLTYCLVYLFGNMYYLVLILNIYLGLYLFFKKKKPNIVLGLNGAAIVCLLVFLLIASSSFNGANLNNWHGHFKENFNAATASSLKINLSKLGIVGGGLFGYASYTLFVSLLGTFMTTIIVFLVIAGCLYILLKKPITILIKKIKTLVIKIKEKKNGSSNSNNHILDEVNEFNNESYKKEINLEEDRSRKYGKLTFDIFHEPIFDEDEISKVEEVIVEENHNFDFNSYNEVNNVQEEIVNIENTEVKFSDEGLEFFGDEEEVAATQEVVVANEEKPIDYREPFLQEEVKVKEESILRTDFKEIDDIYSLLKDNTENNAYSELREEVELNCEKINQKINELNIKASVSGYIIGPCVTRYEIVPEIGVRVSSIVNIENDLKLALAAVKTRMEAPIPGKSAVGIEVANKKRYPVYLKEVISKYADDNSRLLVGIGRDLNNNEVVLNIDKMPHLLVAGATGSGKSVCINSMIVSLLLRTTPEEVKMILIDPKKVEMLPYANMPHLLCPVVVDPKKASMALKKVVKEMDRRYDEFANNGVRNIEGYNKLMESKGEKPLCNIVVIIDELADLMLVAAKEVEESIQRITQLARAAGIYLIVATQRPSVDVITGVIKANIPSRIAFAVSSQIDSRTIIDRGGAEELLGRGDMLMDISGSGALTRVQGVYVSDDEIFNVVNYIKSKYNVNFDEEFLNLEEEKKEEINNLMISEDTNNDDSLYEDVKDFVIRNQRASTSLLQRYFTLGYARAARMMDRLEAEGVISGANGAKPREVLMKYNEGENNNG